MSNKFKKTAETVKKEFRSDYEMRSYYDNSDYEEVTNDIFHDFFPEAKKFVENDFKEIKSEMLEYLKEDMGEDGKNIVDIDFRLEDEAIMTVTFSSEVNESLLARIADWIEGQYADGWGEGLEQQDFASYAEEYEVEYEDEDGEYYTDYENFDTYLSIQLWPSNFKLKY